MAELGLAVGPDQHADRAARPARRVPGGDRHHRRLDRALSRPKCATSSTPRSASCRSRSGRGQKGSSAMPHKRNPITVGATRRAGAAAAWLRAGRARGPGAVARARHQPLVGRARGAARRDDAAALHAGALPRAWSMASSCGPSGCARTSSAAWACSPRAALLTALVEQGGLAREEPTRSSSAPPCARPTSVASCASWWRQIPIVTRRADRCRRSRRASTSAHVLRHVDDASSSRLDQLEEVAHVAR